MKRIVTLFLSFGLLGSVAAQTTAEREEARRIILGQPKGTTPDSKESRDVILGGDNRRIYDERDNRYPDTYPAGSSRQTQIDRVNREYDSKIHSIRYNRSLSTAEKERIIRQLENDRRRRINEINKYYNGNDRKNDDDDDDDDDDDNYKKSKKGNNGNHYGWQKGKGNKHKKNG